MDEASGSGDVDGPGCSAGLDGAGCDNNIVPHRAQNAASGRFSALHLGQITILNSLPMRIYYIF
jgi:hypothetical protein